MVQTTIKMLYTYNQINCYTLNHQVHKQKCLPKIFYSSDSLSSLISVKNKFNPSDKPSNADQKQTRIPGHRNNQKRKGS